MTEDVPSTTTVEELLGLLGNETRMRIMQVLWAEFDFASYVTEEQEGVPFAQLRDAAGIDDPGNFNYHLGQLTDVLVDGRDDGYVLTPLGYNLMRAIDRYTIYEYDPLEPWTLEDPCPYCDGRLSAAYRREVLEVTCQDCGGLSGEGNFTYVELPATGAGELDRGELLDAATLAMGSKIRSSARGICWDCYAPMTLEVDVCRTHERGERGICPTCTDRHQSKVDVACPTCGTSGHGPVLEYAIASSPVATFFDGVDRGPWSVGEWRYRLAALGAASERVLASDPVAVAFTFTVEDASYEVVVEERDAGIKLVRPERLSA